MNENQIQIIKEDNFYCVVTESKFKLFGDFDVIAKSESEIEAVKKALHVTYAALVNCQNKLEEIAKSISHNENYDLKEEFYTPHENNDISFSICRG